MSGGGGGGCIILPLDRGLGKDEENPFDDLQ